MPGTIANINAGLGGGVAQWVAAGDYNREPTNPVWNPPAGTLCPPDGITRPKSEKQFDYIVKSTATPVTGEVHNTVQSDHFPVLFDF